MVVEAILILVILFGITQAVSNYFKSNEVFKNMVEGPWKSLSSMIQNGVWDPKGHTSSKNLHPSYQDRHVSVEGESAK